MLDDPFPHLVVQVQVGAGDEAGHDDDGRAADERLRGRPLDLLQLGPRLLEEAETRRAGPDLVAALAALRRRLLRLLLGGRARLGCRPERGGAPRPRAAPPRAVAG